MMLFSQVIKDATVADVHAGGILGAKKKKKYATPKGKPFEVPVGKAFTSEFKVAKVDEDQRMIFGWASVCALDGKLVVDKQDDSIPTEEIEKAAYDFVLYSRDQGDMHSRRGVGKLVESVVFTAEKEKCGIVAKNENGETIHGWWTGFYVTSDEVWKLHRAGKRPQFSIGGNARRSAT